MFEKNISPHSFCYHIMIEVGFWRRFEDKTADLFDSRPWPRSGALDPVVLREVIEYLRCGFLESFEFGYSTCRICGDCSRETGCCSLTDGTYVWPEGLPHYLMAHMCGLPSTFIVFARANLSNARARHCFRRSNPSVNPLLEWHVNEQKASPANSETVEWVLQNSTLGEDAEDREIVSARKEGCIYCWGGWLW
jgi:hypothetical protein